MNWKQTPRIQSFAHYFCIIIGTFVFSTQALGASSESTGLLESALLNRNDGCAQAKAEAMSVKRDLDRACRDSGLGSKCMTQAKTCEDLGGADEYGSSADLLMAFSTALGVPQSGVSSACPRYSGQGYFERKDKYEKELDDINDKMGDLKKDLANLNKDFNKDVQEVQENIADAQNDLKKKQLDIKKEQRERVAEMAKTASELAKNIRAQQSLILQKRQEITNIYRSKNSSLITLSEGATKRACMKKVRELKKDYEAVSAGSGGSYIARAKQKKEALQDEFDNCMLQFDQQRAALIEQTEQKIQQAQDAINNAQSDIDNMNQQLTTMNSQEAEAKNDDTTSMNNASTALSEKISRATSKLQSLQQTTQQEAQGLTEKQNYYKQKSVSISNSLMMMGPAPVDETSTARISDVESAYNAYVDAVRNVPMEDDNGKECVFDRSVLGPDSSRGRSSSRRTYNSNRGTGSRQSGRR